MKKILKYIVLSVFITAAFSCEEDATSNSVDYVTFDTDAVNATVAIGAGTATTDITIYAGNNSGSTVNVMVDMDASTAEASAYSVPSTVTIPSGSNVGTLTVTLNEAGLSLLPSSIVVTFLPNQGFSTGDAITINAALVCPTASDVTIAVTTDNWPDETTWTLTDGSGGEVAAGGPYDNPADDFSTISTDLSLDPGVYTMTVFDSYGDGGGSFTVVNGCSQAYASGAAPDAGGGYPVVTSASGSFTIE